MQNAVKHCNALYKLLISLQLRNMGTNYFGLFHSIISPIDEQSMSENGFEHLGMVPRKSLDKFGDPLHRFAAITVSACNLRPTSRGAVRIRSADLRDQPMIQPNYLSTAEDRQVAADAIRVTRRLVGQQALKKYSPEEYQPRGPISDDTEDLLKAVGEIGTTIFHPVGTAKMGLPSDPGAVVDERLRVMELKGLRVVDASVMPSIVSGNTNTPTIMIAEKGAGFILADART